MSRAARLGAFIVATLAILVAGVFIIGGKQYLFSSTYQLKAQFDNVAGLDAGADVRVGGVHSGTVRNIVLPHKPGDKVTVVMDLGKSTHEIIKQDSVVYNRNRRPVGESVSGDLVWIGSVGRSTGWRSSSPASRHSKWRICSKRPATFWIAASRPSRTPLRRRRIWIRSAPRLTAAKELQERWSTTSSSTPTSNRLRASMRDTMAQAQAGVTDFQENMEALKHSFFVRGYFKNRGYEDSAELAKNEIEKLPQGTPIKEFTYSSKQLFDKQDSAKLKNQKSLNAGGEFLANNQFGFAVVVVSAGMEGDTQKDLVLTEARAMVVREYLVGTFRIRR